MSNVPKKQPRQPHFHYQPQVDTPPRPKVKTQWDLAALYYKNERDPQIEEDLKTTERLYTKFAKKWRQRPFTTDVATLKAALGEYEALAGRPEVARPGRYFSFRSTLNTNDHVAEKQLALISRRFRKVANQLLFFPLELGKLPKAEQKKLVRNPELEHFRYYLEHLFLGAAHQLSEEQEKIINLKGRQSYAMWVDMTEKIISNRTVTWKGKTLAIPEALETIETLPSKQKQKLWDIVLDEMEQIGEVAEHEFNAIITDVRTEDDVRGYQKPYSATAISYEDSEKSIESLVEAVSTKGFSLSRKFYKLKAEFHGVAALNYSQRYDTIGKELALTYDQSVDICRDVFYGLKPAYGEIFDRMLANGQIDAFPKPGKRGGAFMSAEIAQPTQVMLNHVNNFKSLETLAHEMGHAIHAQRGKHLSPFYEGHSIVTAETASTLFENLVFDAVYSQASPEQQMVLLHDRITRDISTIERQIAFFNCELEIHRTIQTHGAMSNDELRATMFKHLQSYLGKGVALQPRDGYSYVYIPHLRFGFYVYSYAFGLLMSTIMANHYKADNRYIENIDKFLCAGASADVATIFKSIGINTTKTDTFTEALKNQAADITTFARFVKQTK